MHFFSQFFPWAMRNASLIRRIEGKTGSVKRSGGSLQNLVTMTIFINDLHYGDQSVKVRDEMFPDGNFPASAVRIRRKVDSDREENGKKSF